MHRMACLREGARFFFLTKQASVLKIILSMVTSYLFYFFKNGIRIQNDAQ